MDSTVAKQISNTQINILLRAAAKLYAISLQHGTGEQQRLADTLLNGIKLVAPKFAFDLPDWHPQHEVVRKRPSPSLTFDKKRELRNRIRKERQDAQRELP